VAAQPDYFRPESQYRERSQSEQRGPPSGKGLALSTANRYSAVQPGGSLYGLQHSNPVDATVAYQGSEAAFGTASDPIVGDRVGGVNVFGGGLALYLSGGKKIGAVGVSGDTSCTDHFVTWRVRQALGLDLRKSCSRPAF
jgi:uncharacterized protein GlcG (DUF336 family)